MANIFLFSLATHTYLGIPSKIIGIPFAKGLVVKVNFVAVVGDRRVQIYGGIVASSSSRYFGIEEKMSYPFLGSTKFKLFSPKNVIDIGIVKCCVAFNTIARGVFCIEQSTTKQKVKIAMEKAFQTEFHPLIFSLSTIHKISFSRESKICTFIHHTVGAGKSFYGDTTYLLPIGFSLERPMRSQLPAIANNVVRTLRVL